MNLHALTETQVRVLKVIRDHPLECPQWMALMADMSPQTFGRVANALVKKNYVYWEHYAGHNSHDGKQRITYRPAK